MIGKNAAVARWLAGAALALTVSSAVGASTVGAATGLSQQHVRATADALVVSVAKTSTSEVTELHDLAVGLGQSHGLPSTVVPAAASQLAASFRSELASAKSLHESPAAPTQKLVLALTDYRTLSSRLAQWTSRSKQPLASSFFTQLRTADATWRTALSSIGKTAHQNLLAGVPTLLYPKS